ncbi:hypothetical protein [Corynebacterium crudilactis]|uniref:hypothetical protein n=1 Tax=Corynebacterium crudilactis TaxID=1652495 RepID=UPI0012FDB637|nr:hypothetical protein [Corynebacterium crudilactis]
MGGLGVGVVGFGGKFALFGAPRAQRGELHPGTVTFDGESALFRTRCTQVGGLGAGVVGFGG